jgi:methyl-accepting chemotaxis protein WspA
MFNAFSQIRLRDRTLIGFSIPTILIFGFSSMVYITASKTLDTFKQIAIEKEQLIIWDQNLADNLNMQNDIYRYLIDGSPAAIEKVKKDDARLDQQFERIKAMATEPDQREIVMKQLELHEQLKAAGDKAIARSNAEGGISKTIQMEYIQTSSSLIEALKTQHGELNDNLKAREQQLLNAAQSDLISLEIMAAIVVLMTLTIAGMMAYMISNALGKRVTRVVTVAKKISTGDLSAIAESQDNSQDEIGQLMLAFHQMVERLNGLMGQVQRSSIQVTAACTQLSASGQQLEGTMTEQVASTNQVTTTAKQIATTSEELVHTMDELASLSQQTTHTATNQQQDLRRMGTTMQQLAGATDQIADRLGSISEKANNINTIVATITKVADQTNLLSLNAAIEAEKAGESGLGFSVVAKEIRRLADQTAIATVDIEQMIKEMQAAVSTGVMEMDKFSREVRQGVAEVSDITEQVGLVIEQVQELAPRFDAVNQGMEMQFQGAQQISEAMVQLSNASTQTADSLQEINRTIDHLNQAEQSLRREVMQFRLDEAQSTIRPATLV